MKLRFKDENGNNYPNWDKKKLEEIATISKGKGISKNEIDENGLHSCIRYGELYTQYNENISSVLSKTNAEPRSHVLSESGDILIPASGEVAVDLATASVVNIDNVLIGSDINIVKTKINSIYLAYYLNNKSKKDIFKLAQGSSIMHIYPDSLKKLECAIPKSLEEQEKIGSFFKLQDEVIELKEELKEELIKEKREYKKGLLQKIFNQELRFKDENGNNYPDWEEKKLDELLEKSFSGGTPTSTNSNYYHGDINFIGSGEIGKYTTAKKINDLALKNSSAKKISKGDILYAMYGATAGKVEISPINGAINQAILCLDVKDYQSKYFILSLLKHNKTKILFKYLQGGQGNLSAGQVLNLINEYPQSIEEQEKIGNLFKLIDEEIELLENEVRELKQKKKYYLSVMM